MLLAIDIGNTNIHFGLVHPDGTLCCTWRARTIRNKMADEYAVLLRSFFVGQGLDLRAVDAVVMASVVPELTGTFVELSERYLKRKPLNVDHSLDTGITIRLDNPRELGPDRLVNAVAAVALYGTPAIVIDFGTATTYDIIDAHGDYLGGAIAPGIGLAHDALVERAARLLAVDLVPPPSVIGSNTIQAMQSGLFLGYIAMIEGLIARFKAELGSDAPVVIATGGLAAHFAEHTTVIDQIAPNLTLDGLRLLWERLGVPQSVNNHH
ncbi:MAG: type III pantothenate kinase [Chloroflexi bacterium]|nr:type III pantothenate kinase [Chloroflexota bacterium]